MSQIIPIPNIIRLSASSIVPRTLRTTLNSVPPLSQTSRKCVRPAFVRLCPHCQRHYRVFCTYPRSQYSSKRLLMTESTGAHRTESLNTGPPPPRNLGVPETSIAGGLDGDARTWPMRAPPAPKSSITSPKKQSMSEEQAQHPMPVRQKPVDPTTSQTPPTPTSRPAGKSRLRARKAAMTLTPQAVEHVRQLLDSPEPKIIRVGVKNKGCSGSSYHLEYVDAPGRFDELVEQDGVRVLIDSKALIKVIGSEMDWVEDKLSARFTFRNPNIKEQCGCGESFSV